MYDSSECFRKKTHIQIYRETRDGTLLYTTQWCEDTRCQIEYNNKFLA